MFLSRIDRIMSIYDGVIKFLFWNDRSFVSSRKYEYVIQVIKYDINYNAIYCFSIYMHSTLY